MNHPVVHVSYNDAKAFCNFHNARLPYESEWEYAARGGLEQQNFPWGNNRMGEDRSHLTNIFQVRAFKVNKLSLFIEYKG